MIEAVVGWLAGLLVGMCIKAHTNIRVDTKTGDIKGKLPCGHSASEIHYSFVHGPFCQKCWRTGNE